VTWIGFHVTSAGYDVTSTGFEATWTTFHVTWTGLRVTSTAYPVSRRYASRHRTEMNRATYDALLKSLQKLEKAIAKAGVASVRASPSLHRRVEALHLVSETGGSLDDYTALLAGRSAVQLLLRTVYVRVLEDLGLLDPPRIRGERGFDAFRAVAPALGVRAYLRWTFRDLAADFPALFTPLDDELPLPSEDLCKQVWELWHDKDGKGNLVYDWSGGDFESRFLGDLYQDLDADVRERYALLQTPDFVEEYILDQTLTPALVEFDPARLKEKGEAFRVLDPTCGSGHFLIGAFRRLFDYWKGQGLEEWDAAVRAMESVWGCDINPYAVDVARFRLLLEVMSKAGVRDLERLNKVEMNLRAMDSLIPWEGARGQGAQGELFEAQGRLEKYATEEDRERNKRFLKRAFHVVVGNPPYVTPKDPQKRDDYRVFWPNSAAGGYGLAAPFCERLFSLGTGCAFVGQITGNAFIKREFGATIIEHVLPHWDLTDIVDASGAFIPGHGTPTVILIGRAQAPASAKIRVVGGKRGEPKVPEVPARGKVWLAIVAAGKEPDDRSPFVTVSLYAREMFHKHPWNVNGGGAPQLQAFIAKQGSAQLSQRTALAGFGAIIRMDDAYVLQAGSGRRWAITKPSVQSYVDGESVRDWGIAHASDVVFPHSRTGTVEPESLGKYFRPVR
jgi:SAM-dependent methyltransferase